MGRIEQGRIYWVDFGSKKGHVQLGLRPALVIQSSILNEKLSTVTVIPITSNLNRKGLITTAFLPSKNSGLKFDSVALLFQITTIDKKYMQNKCGELTPFEYNVLRMRLFRLMN